MLAMLDDLGNLRAACDTWQFSLNACVARVVCRECNTGVRETDQMTPIIPSIAWDTLEERHVTRASP
jgi:hypothetical protein